MIDQELHFIPYNHRVVIITLKASSFQNGSQCKFVNVSELEIDQFKKMRFLKKRKMLQKFGVKLFKDRFIKFLFFK